MPRSPAWPLRCVLREPARIERRIDQRSRELTLVDVERADRDRARRHPLHELAIDVVLLVFGRHVRRSADEHELGSIQADAFGARAQRLGDIVGPLDVGLEDDRLAVARLQRAVLARARSPPPGAVTTRAFRFLPQRRRRIDDDFASLAVDDHRRAGRHPPADVVQADHRRHAERSREDRGVIRAASGVGREPADSRPIELRDDRRRQLVGDEHARRVEILQPIAGAALFVAQIHAQAAGDVVQVALALVQVRIVDVVEDRGELRRARAAPPIRR